MQTPPHVYAVYIILSVAIFVTLTSLKPPDFDFLFQAQKQVGKAYLARGTCAFIHLLAPIRNLHFGSLKIPKFR